MLMNRHSSSYSVKSFYIDIYDRSFEELVQFRLPVSVAAPFANRLFREILNIPNWETSVREPWYSLEGHQDAKFLRAPRPVGPTSLMGERYEPAHEPEPRSRPIPGHMCVPL